LGFQNLNKPEIICFLFVENFKELEAIMEEMRTNFKELINSIVYLYDSEEFRLNFYPGVGQKNTILTNKDYATASCTY